MSTFRHFLSFSLLPVVAALAGCGMGAAPSGSVAPVLPSPAAHTLQGRLYGGQQPVVGATIQLYQVGTTGYGTGATPLINQAQTPVVTDRSGGFYIPPPYGCATGSLVYLTSTGGNPGAGTNSAAVFIVPLGLCENIPSIPFVTMNEVTTVATVWALNQFMTGVNIGAPTTNQVGLSAAFTDAAQLVNIGNGLVPGTSLPAGATVPTAKIYAIANTIASCINSSGPGGGGLCDKLFGYATPLSGPAPTDVLQAAINVARAPWQHAADLIALAPPASPFMPSLATASDLTLGITYQVSTAPSSLAIDSNQNVWVTSPTDRSLKQLTRSGSVVQYSNPLIYQPNLVAIDSSGNIAESDLAGGSIFIMSPNGAHWQQTNPGASGMSGESALAADPFGQFWVVGNDGTNSYLTRLAPGYYAASNSIQLTSTAGTQLGIAISGR